MKPPMLFATIIFFFNIYNCYSQSSDYFPIQKGNSYTYKYSSLSYPGNGSTFTGDGEFTLEVIDSVLSNDTIVWNIQSTYSIQRFETGRGSFIDSGIYFSKFKEILSYPEHTIILGYLSPLRQGFKVDTIQRFYFGDTLIKTIYYAGSNPGQWGHIQLEKNIGLKYNYTKYQVGFPGYAEEEATLIKYHLTTVDFDANNSVTGIDFVLHQNYPNPFNPITTISYHLTRASNVSLIVYDYLGREIKTLVNDFQQGGNYKVIFDGKNLSSGIYFCNIRAGSFNYTKKMLLLK